jgi:DNA polymerase
MSDMNEALRSYYLDAMGIRQWRLRTAPVANGAAAGNTAVPAAGAVDPWRVLQARVAGCTDCALHAGRTQTVFGVGDRQAEWMIIGEAPGADEDRQGEPFVGRAGQLLNAMLAALGLARDAVYIANILKCRPPNNRDPRPEEMAACEGYLQQQVALVQPRIILAVGGVAAKNLLKSDAPVGKLRGRRHEYGDTGIPLVVTYHPAYLLRSPKEKRKSWQDLRFARDILNETLA